MDASGWQPWRPRRTRASTTSGAERLATPQLQALFQIESSKAADKEVGRGHVTHVPADPGLAWCRQRDGAPGKVLLAAIRRRPLPLMVDAPSSLVANMFENPQNPKQRWVHLLNVSHMMPEGDTGFPRPETTRRER